MKLLIAAAVAVLSLPCRTNAQLAPPAEDLNASLSISPETPNDTWPKNGENNSLAPNYLLKVVVVITPKGKVGGRDYVLDPNSIAPQAAPDSGLVWVANKEKTGYDVTNASPTAKQTAFKVKCTWKLDAAPAGGGKGAGSTDIIGSADSNLDLLDSVLFWTYTDKVNVKREDPLLQTTMQWGVELYDTKNFQISRTTLVQADTVEAEPVYARWNFTIWPAIFPYLISGQAASKVAMVGKIRLKLSEGAVKERISDEIVTIPVKFITPSGDPVGTPVDGGDGSAALDGSNQFTFNSAGVGAITLNLKVHSSALGALGARILDRFSFEADAIGDSVQTPVTKASVPLNGDILSAVSVFTGLPTTNAAFGRKAARLKFDGNVVDSANYQIFFSKYSKNHPASNDAVAGMSPNWFYYWKQGGVCGIPANAKYDPTLLYGKTAPATSTVIYLGTQAAQQNYPAYLTGKVPPYSDIFLIAGGDSKGIGCVAEIVAHELHHRTLYLRRSARRLLGDFDSDFDGISDSDENGLDDIISDPNDSDTYDLKTALKYFDSQDEELRCLMEEIKAPMPYFRSLDWANPGWNSKDQFGP